MTKKINEKDRTMNLKDNKTRYVGGFGGRGKMRNYIIIIYFENQREKIKSKKMNNVGLRSYNDLYSVDDNNVRLCHSTAKKELCSLTTVFITG